MGKSATNKTKPIVEIAALHAELTANVKHLTLKDLLALGEKAEDAGNRLLDIAEDVRREVMSREVRDARDHSRP